MGHVCCHDLGAYCTSSSECCDGLACIHHVCLESTMTCTASGVSPCTQGTTLCCAQPSSCSSNKCCGNTGAACGVQSDCCSGHLCNVVTHQCS